MFSDGLGCRDLHVENLSKGLPSDLSYGDIVSIKNPPFLMALVYVKLT